MQHTKRLLEVKADWDERISELFHGKYGPQATYDDIQTTHFKNKKNMIEYEIYKCEKDIIIIMNYD